MHANTWLMIAILLAGCATKPQAVTRPTPSRKATPRPRRPAPLPPVKLTRSPLTPRLQALVRDLQSKRKGQVFDVWALIKRHLPDYDFQHYGVPRLAAVQVFEVQRGFLLAAVIKLAPKSSKRGCAYGEPEAEDLFLARIFKDHNGKDHLGLVGLKSNLFRGTNRRVVFPPVTPQLPAFQLQYDLTYEGGDDSCQPNGRSHEARKLEIYRWGHGEVEHQYELTLKSALSGTGVSTATKATVRWVKGKASETHYLISVILSTDTVPTSADGSGGSGVSVSCSRTTKAWSISATGDFVKLTPNRLKVLTRSEPVLARLPPYMESSSTKVCLDLSD